MSAPVPARGGVVTSRPRRLTVVAWACAAVLGLGAVVLALALEGTSAGSAASGNAGAGSAAVGTSGASSYGVAFTPLTRALTAALGLLCAGLVLLLTRPRLRADSAGLRVRNVGRWRQVPWEHVHGVRLDDSSPWLAVDLGDDETLPVLAVQAADGARARETARAVAALHAASRRPAPGGAPGEPGEPAGPGEPGAGEPAAGPTIAGPRAPGDSGEADPALTAALAAWVQAPGPATQARVYAALPSARLLVPVVATLVEAETAPATGLRAEKTSEMALVTLVGRSGATALPAFLSAAAMRRWRLEARPVPVAGREACAAALEGGHAAVVVEPGGAAFPVEGAALESLAAGWVPAAAGPGGAAPGDAAGPARLASRRVRGGLALSAPAEPPSPALAAALARALAAEPDVAEAYVVDVAAGDEAPSRTVGLVLARDVAAAEVAALAARVSRALGPALAEAGGLDLAVLDAAQRDRAAALAPRVAGGSG